MAGYEHLVLIPPGSPLTFETFAQKVRDTLPPAAKLRVEIGKDSVRVVDGAWSLRLHWETAAHLVIESRDIAQRFGQNRPDQSRIASCDKRIDLGSDPDPGMMYFNTYALVLGALESLSDGYLFDPLSGDISAGGTS
jgi:hypothetical protein